MTPRRQRLVDIEAVLALEPGRRFLYDLLERVCARSRCTFSQDAGQMAFLEGRRSIGLELADFLARANPKLHELMVLEGMRAVPPVPLEEDHDA